MVLLNSVDWTTIRADLCKKAAGLLHEREIKKMINNIGYSVTELSRAEVESRRGKKHKAAELVQKVNNDIIFVEEFILVAALIG
jgi:hypothetical protein